MDKKKLDKWASLLLDTGKRNNLVNFRDTKASTLEILLPNADTLFDKVESSANFEVFDPNIEDENDFIYSTDGSMRIAKSAIYDRPIIDGVPNGGAIASDNSGEAKEAKANREAFLKEYAPRIKKSNQILLYNPVVGPITAVKNIAKRAREYVEETGVNVAYIAFGFINWKENSSDGATLKAPILLAPISFKNQSAISPWHLKMTDEEIVVNPTFNYKLESEKNVKLPEYEDEGLHAYLDKIEAIVAKLGWTVTRECKIGIFSFLKLNMYKDLKNNQAFILTNDNVKMLLGEPLQSEAGTLPVAERKPLDNPLISLHNVVDADSSQIEAIEMAKSGVSFVLQGPPGTGKSQTITNIIAECIHDGKKVLFVSEKQAALNVVYDKLRKAGLEEFCLELHSYKSNKKDVIEDLCRTLRTPRTAVSQKAEEIIKSKELSREALDSYETELHAKREIINRSLYQLYDDYSECRKAPEVKVVIPEISSKGDDYLTAANSLLAQYVEFIPTIGYRYTENPWYGYINSDTSFSMLEKVKSAMNAISKVVDEYIALKKLIEEKYGIICNTFSQAELWDNYFTLASESDILTPAFLKQAACSYMLERLSEMEALGKEVVSLKEGIEKEYDEDIYKLDAKDAHKRLTRQFTSGFGRIFNSEYKKLINDIRINKKDGKKPSYNAAVLLTQNINDYKVKYDRFMELEGSVKNALGASYKGIYSDWQTIISQITKLKELMTSEVSFGRLEAYTVTEYGNSKNEFADIARQIKELKAKSSESIELLRASFDKSVFDIDNSKFGRIATKLNGCLEHMDMVENWNSFYKVLYELSQKQLLPFITTAIDLQIPADSIVIAFRRNYFRMWIDYILHTNPTLTAFNRVSHDKEVENFSRQDVTHFSISKVKIKAEISSRRPSLDMISSGSAVSLILREGEKKRKQKSIRTLMEEAGDLIQVIKPCFLMSPLSVSTFLSSEKIHFDTVVFDEASQIFPQDAIGAIYRGKQLIVVGDSKQMPPSNFFNSAVDNGNDDEEIGDVADFESILDLCSTAFAQQRLRWHYRSRYEQLISFSNRNFYDNDLISFPSATTDRPGIGVDYYYVDGVFDRTSKSNRKEAEFIVDLIYKNIEEYPDRSLGVVAFSISQQDLIERLLSKRRVKEASKEEFFSHDREEPFFIKNLETVQGDERDTIIFSVGYAKDSSGKLLHNFGPLNREGGERRLNVAVTRAKQNVQLVSSLHHTDINLQKTAAEGARLLKEYLDYAENGEIALERALSVNSVEQHDSEFEQMVYDFLTDNGFEVNAQVGCSNYKIDMAIKRPGTSDYVLAIECDGASYHSSRNARDRDRLRQQILERMGWRFYRIWSTDWFRNAEIEKQRLLEAAREAISTEQKVVEESTETVQERSTVPATSEENEGFGEILKEVHLRFPTYKMADMVQINSVTNDLPSFVREVMEVEAPLSEEWLIKRIPWIFGREKVTSVVQREYESQMADCIRYGIVRRNGFLYIQGQNSYVLRVPASKEEAENESAGEDIVKREIKYICPEELASGMLIVIGQNVSVDREGLFKYIANVLGFTRVADNIEHRLEEALTLIAGMVDIDGNTISLKKSE